MSHGLEECKSRSVAYCLESLNIPTISLSKASVIQAVHCLANLQERKTETDRRNARKSKHLHLGEKRTSGKW